MHLLKSFVFLTSNSDWCFSSLQSIFFCGAALPGYRSSVNFICSCFWCSIFVCSHHHNISNLCCSLLYWKRVLDVISRILFITHGYLIVQWKCCWLVSHISRMIIQCQVLHAADYLSLISALSHASSINSSISIFDWKPYLVTSAWSPVLILHCMGNVIGVINTKRFIQSDSWNTKWIMKRLLKYICKHGSITC